MRSCSACWNQTYWWSRSEYCLFTEGQCEEAPSAGGAAAAVAAPVAQRVRHSLPRVDDGASEVVGRVHLVLVLGAVVRLEVAPENGRVAQRAYSRARAREESPPLGLLASRRRDAATPLSDAGSIFARMQHLTPSAEPACISAQRRRFSSTAASRCGEGLRCSRRACCSSLGEGSMKAIPSCGRLRAVEAGKAAATRGRGRGEGGVMAWS